MKKFIFSQIILLLCVFSAFPQGAETLDKRIAAAVSRNLRQWKTKDAASPFEFIRGTYGAGIEASWASGDRKANLKIYLLKSKDEVDEQLRHFLIRGVIPPNRKVTNLGDRAHLVETASRVEIAFAEANVYSILNVEFPDTRADRKLPYYYASAPQKEVETALEFARVVAEAIDGAKTFSPCFNNFFRPKFPAAATTEEKLRLAVESGDRETVKSLIAKNARVNHIFPDGETVLHLAVRQGCAETVKILVEARADINAKTAKGVTPLMLAANYGDVELVKYLISAGADLRAKDTYGRNAAFFVISSVQGMRPGFPAASIEQKSEIVKYLAARGLDINEKDSLDNNTLLTALTYDCYGITDCKELIDLVLTLGADVNAENKYGRTALINSVDRMNATVQKEFVSLLLGRGADPNHRDKNNLSALGYALKELKLYEKDPAYSKHVAETIRLLKDAGAIE